jgi:hypothetical protein
MSEHTYTPFTIIRGIFIMAFVWPAGIPLLIMEWRVKHGKSQRTPIDGGKAVALTIVSIPCTIALYVGLIVWWLSNK